MSVDSVNSMSMMAEFGAEERGELNRLFEMKLEELIRGSKIFKEQNVRTLFVGRT